MAMPRHRIGASGPEVSAFALGSWHTYDRMDFHDAVALVRRAVDAGVDFFDVGVYSGFPLDGKIHYGFTDILFGRIVEKAGVERSQYKMSQKLWLEARPFGPQLDRALYRVNSDHSDFAVLGDIRTDDVDLEGIVEELAELVADGRLGAWGVNNWSAEHLRQAHEIAQAKGLPGPQMTQLKYSLCRRAMAEDDAFRALFQDEGISLQASDVFEGGILAGNLNPDRMIGRDPGDIREQIRAVAPRAAEIAADLGATPAQLAIAFTLTHPATVNVLFGCTRMGQLEDNLGALDVLERHGADAIRERVADLWLDSHVLG